MPTGRPTGRPPRPHVRVTSVNREELAWAAGFFDGEGSIRLHDYARGYAPYVYIQITQVGRAELDRFQQAVLGLGGVYGPYRDRRGSRQPSFCYRCGRFGDSQAVMAALWPFLGATKRTAALSAFRAYHNLTLLLSPTG